MKESIFTMANISKSFGGVQALDNVSLDIQAGEIHGICGENGAGKSTMMKILSGVIPVDDFQGKIQFEQQDCAFKSVKDSEAQGIVIIHQELALIPYLSIMENIFLSNEIAKYGIIDWLKTAEEAQKILQQVGLVEDPQTLVANIGVGKQQLVEIAKALSKEVKILILDEPTAALNEGDSQKLLDLLGEFKRAGLTSIIISHKLKEILAIADRVTVIRDGKIIETLTKELGNLTEKNLIKGMVGRELANRYPQTKFTIGKTIFKVEDWTVNHPLDIKREVVKNVNFQLKAGEIVGIAGLMGAGRTELAMSLFGRAYGNYVQGRCYIKGQEVNLSTVPKAITAGLAYVTEDRKRNGLILLESILKNISLASLRKFSDKLVLEKNQERQVVTEYQQQLGIKSPSLEAEVAGLSGGNQQKVVLAKWLLTDPEILILDEPTRGIDVGAKYEIYQLIQELAKKGKAICLISSELPEILGMTNRIYTMSHGQITGEFHTRQTNQEELMVHMTKQVGAYGN